MNAVRNVYERDLASYLNSAGGVVFWLEGSKCHSKSNFFSAIGQTFPLDPPLGSGLKWDALCDSLWNAIDHLKAERVTLVWRDSEIMARIAPEDYRTAIDCFESVAHDVADPNTGIEILTRFEVMLVRD